MQILMELNTAFPFLECPNGAMCRNNENWFRYFLCLRQTDFSKEAKLEVKSWRIKITKKAGEGRTLRSLDAWPLHLLGPDTQSSPFNHYVCLFLQSTLMGWSTNSSHGVPGQYLMIKIFTA
ncbi:hypothetical protein CDAR_86961 [Caerostris darwini]|uniref:Uncharacterized protein n=1 Tax=Caerostris darwini TaxID=1538125 RepID=A0AAV4U7Y0_9ARAC|nr:hypothetical protein CDAR_86961 [Caerostris darwini]